MWSFLIAELVTIVLVAGASVAIVKRKALRDFVRKRLRRAPSTAVASGATKELADPDSEQDDWDDDTPESNLPAEFFPDKPSRRDYLDYQPYAETLAGLIAPEETRTPLTVGVFGAWGSGKTTLMRMIRESLREIQKDEDRFVFVRFDAWKFYKEDALWRAMLLRVLAVLRRKRAKNPDQELKDVIERLEESLYRDVEWKEKGGLIIDWPKLAQAGASGALKLSFSFVPGLSMLAKAVEAAQSKIGDGTVANDVSAIANAFQRDIVTHHQNQLLHIEQFQREFSWLVREHFKNQRLVIFVDDLDRCLPEKAIEVLEAIKLFLDVKGCVFILGIDEEVIRRGLEAKYKELASGNALQPLFSRHYIEKLIQLPFYLPSIEPREVRSYIDSLKVAWPEEGCLDVFSEALSPNPRQIKRTINVYMLLWKLAERRRSSLKDTDTPLQAVTALRLAKVVILQTAYPKVFDHLKSDALLLKQLELSCCDDDSSGENGASLDPVLMDAVKQPSLKKLFQLLSETETASFAKLELEELTTFFSLARRAPLVTEVRANEATTAAAEPGSDVAPPPGKPFQLRSSVRDFVGRKTELDRVVTALRNNTSIAIVTGMAGAGKTEFALRVGEQLRGNYPDGQLFFDMQGSEPTPVEPADALPILIRALGGRIRSRKLEELAATYRSQLNGKKMLIVLDDAANLEQVNSLIPPKGSALLITSRNALILPGMISVTLEQLAPQEAIELLQEIAAVPPNIAAEICALCGYLPPAVRAAANTLAASPDLDAEDYASQLRDEQNRMDVLGAQGVNVKLEASFSLSYSRLAPETQTVFRKLAVFSGTFDATAEEVICDDPQHVHLSELVRLNLVFYDASEKRYSVQALLRLFARRRLKDDEANAVSRHHAEYYFHRLGAVDALFSMGGESSLRGLKLFDQEIDNITAGFKWSAVHSPELCSDYAKYGVAMLELRKSHKALIEWFTKAVTAARSRNDSRAELSHLINQARAYSASGDAGRAMEILNEALVISKQLKWPQREALILSNLGMAHRDLGNIKEAFEYFKAQLEICRQLDDPQRESNALVNLANALLTIDVKEAVNYYEQALELSKQTADLQTEAIVRGNLGRAYNQLREPQRALEFCQQQLEISQKLGDRNAEAAAHLNIGIAYEQLGKLDEARTSFNTSLEIYKQVESTSVRLVQAWLTRLNRRQQAPDT